MHNVRGIKGRSVLIRFLNFLIIVTALAAGICLIRMVSELRSAFERDRYNTLEYSLQQGEYSDMVRQYYSLYYDVAPFSSTHEESYHVAGYADAAFQHQFFQAMGEKERAAAMAQRMEAHRSGCGSLSVAAGDIDRLLANIPLDR